MGLWVDGVLDDRERYLVAAAEPETLGVADRQAAEPERCRLREHRRPCGVQLVVRPGRDRPRREVRWGLIEPEAPVVDERPLSLRARPALELLGIPLRVQVLVDDHGDVLPDPLHFLQIPERESVVVSAGKEDAVGLDALEEVVGPVARRVVASARRPRPVEGHGEKREGEDRGCGREPAHARGRPGEAAPGGGEPHSGQEAPQVERGDEEVVPLAYLPHGPVRELGPERIAVPEVQVEDEPG